MCRTHCAYSVGPCLAKIFTSTHDASETEESASARWHRTSSHGVLSHASTRPSPHQQHPTKSGRALLHHA